MARYRLLRERWRHHETNTIQTQPMISPHIARHFVEIPPSFSDRFCISYASFAIFKAPCSSSQETPRHNMLQQITCHTSTSARPGYWSTCQLLASHAVSTLLLIVLRLTISTKVMSVSHTQLEVCPDTSALTSHTAFVAPDCRQATNIDHAPHLLATCIRADTSTTWH